jgi:hypothetical protein
VAPFPWHGETTWHIRTCFRLVRWKTKVATV